MIPTQLETARNIGYDLVTSECDYDSIADGVRRLESLHSGMEASNIEIRFWLGILIRTLGTERGKGTIKKLSDDTGVAETTLRIARRFADHFEGDVERMRTWVRNHVKSGKKANWQAVIDLTRANRDPKVLGPNVLIKRLLASVERSAEDLQAANEIIKGLPENEQESWSGQLMGVATILSEEAREFSRYLPSMDSLGSLQTTDMFQSAPRSSDYLAWLHHFPCPINGTLPVDAHHASGTRGGGQKASDYGAIPLDHELHMEYHNIGRESFEKKYNVDMEELTLNYLHRYITGQWLTLQHLPEPI